MFRVGQWLKARIETDGKQRRGDLPSPGVKRTCSVLPSQAISMSRRTGI